MFENPGDRRKVLVEMTADGVARVGRYYGPLVEEGSALFPDATDDELIRMRDWLVAARQLTDRHRARIKEDGVD